MVVIVHLVLNWVTWSNEFLVEVAAIVLALLVSLANILLGLLLDHIAGLILRAQVVLALLRLMLICHLLHIVFLILLVLNLALVWDLLLVKVLAIAEFEEFEGLSVLISYIIHVG